MSFLLVRLLGPGACLAATCATTGALYLSRLFVAQRVRAGQDVGAADLVSAITLSPPCCSILQAYRRGACSGPPAARTAIFVGSWPGSCSFDPDPGVWPGEVVAGVVSIALSSSLRFHGVAGIIGDVLHTWAGVCLSLFVICPSDQLFTAVGDGRLPAAAGPAWRLCSGRPLPLGSSPALRAYEGSDNAPGSTESRIVIENVREVLREVPPPPTKRPTPPPPLGHKVT